jgi:hypothetical protein
LKVILPSSQCFEDTVTFTLFKIGLLYRIEEKHVSLGRKPSMFKAGVSLGDLS